MKRFILIIAFGISINTFSQTLLGPETFDSDIIINGTSGPTNQWFGPNYYLPIDYVSTGGCPNGNAGYQGSWNNYWMNFLRTPAVDCTGLDTIILSVDLSNSYFASHTNDKVYFNMWIDGGYHDAVINQTIFFDLVRNCETIEVVYDLTPYIDKSGVLFYLNASCGYNDSQTYFVKFDNVSISGQSSVLSCNPFAGENDSICGLSYCFNEALLSDTLSTCTWTTFSKPYASSVVNFNNPNDVNTCVMLSDFGQYEFILTETNGACTNSDTISINFIELPNTYAGSDQFVCGLETDLDAIYQYSGFWLNSPEITFIDSTDAQTHIISNHYGVDTLYWVETNQICTAISSVIITFDPCSNIDNIDINKISVSPNPSSGELLIKLNNNDYETLKIINVNGQEISKLKISNNSFSISLEKGTYYLFFSNNKESCNKQIIIN